MPIVPQSSGRPNRPTGGAAPNLDAWVTAARTSIANGARNWIQNAKASGSVSGPVATLAAGGLTGPSFEGQVRDALLTAGAPAPFAEAIAKSFWQRWEDWASAYSTVVPGAFPTFAFRHGVVGETFAGDGTPGSFSVPVLVGNNLAALTGDSTSILRAILTALPMTFPPAMLASVIAAVGLAAITIVQQIPALMEILAQLADHGQQGGAAGALRQAGREYARSTSSNGVGAATKAVAAGFAVVANPSLLVPILCPSPQPDLGNVADSFLAGLRNWIVTGRLVKFAGRGASPARGGPVRGTFQASLGGPQFNL